MTRLQKHTPDEIKTALYQSNGLIRPAARLLSVSPQGLRARINRSKDLQETLGKAREQIIDKAEEALWTCVDKLDPWAIALVLKTLGKNRGYVERQEVTGADAAPIIFRVVRDEK